MKKSELKSIIKEVLSEADSKAWPAEVVRKLEKARTLVIDAHHSSTTGTPLAKGLADVHKKINELISMANKG